MEHLRDLGLFWAFCALVLAVLIYEYWPIFLLLELCIAALVLCFISKRYAFFCGIYLLFSCQCITCSLLVDRDLLSENILQERGSKDLTIEGSRLEYRSQSLLNAFVLGNRYGLSTDIKRQFKKLGLGHFLALSGMHLTYFISFLTLLFWPFRRNRYLRLVFVLIAAIYILYIGAPLSFIRALAMYFIYSLLKLFYIETSGLRVLFMIAFFLVLIDPFIVYDIGFQLSFSAVFSIVYLWPSRDAVRVPLHFPMSKFLNYCIDFICVSIFAQLGVVIWCLYYFESFAFLSSLSSLIFMPLIGVLMALFYSYFFLNIISVELKFLNTSIDFLVDSFLKGLLKLENYGLLIEFESLSIRSLLSIAIVVFVIFFWIRRFTKIRLVWGLVLLLVSSTSFVLEYYFIPKPFFYNGHWYREGSVYKQPIIVLDSALYVRLEDEVFPDFLKSEDRILLHLKASPKINLERICDELKPKVVWIDSYNYERLVKSWKVTLEKRAIPYRDIIYGREMYLK
jgi:competence protein ComEC